MRRVKPVPKKPKELRRVSFFPMLKQSIFLNDLNLVQMLARTPNRGLNYKVWRHCWPQNIHYLITKTEFNVEFLVKQQNHITGDIWGIRYENGSLIVIGIGEEVTGIYERIIGAHKDRTWSALAPDITIRTDNGLEYNPRELDDLIQKKKQMLMERKKELLKLVPDYKEIELYKKEKKKIKLKKPRFKPVKSKKEKEKEEKKAKKEEKDVGKGEGEVRKVKTKRKEQT